MPILMWVSFNLHKDILQTYISVIKTAKTLEQNTVYNNPFEYCNCYVSLQVRQRNCEGINDEKV
jgi:hypothetical protein